MSVEDFGEYEVQKREDGSLFELGRGAMGVTYKAFDTHLHRLVALKTISPAVMARPDAEDRFIREARSAAQLRHPNIATVFRRDKTPGGTHYYVMEFCEGRTIEQVVKQDGPLEWRRALEIAAQVAHALATAARKNLIHRDIKPANLMLVREDEREVLKVIDFGLAKITADDGAAWSSLGTQGFVGTAHFASPEQIKNEPVDKRSDIYSLGATLWFMLAGSPPFAGSIWEVISKHVTSTPDFSLLSAVPQRVVEMIRAMMQKNPADRPQSAQELLREIMECLGASNEHELGTRLPSLVEPPPDASNEPSEIPRVWTLSLVDLLRFRRVLAPLEAWRLGESLAVILDSETFGDASQGALRIHEIIVQFRDPMSKSDAYKRLRESVTAWPPFDVSIEAGDDFARAETVDSGGMKTVFTAGDAAGDPVQQLAGFLYELLGGAAGFRWAPLASLGEKGNAVLQQGILHGMTFFFYAADLVNALRAATADIPAPRPSSPPEPPVSGPEKKAKSFAGNTRNVGISLVVALAVALTFFIVFGWIKLPFDSSSPANADNSAAADAPKVTQPDEPGRAAPATPASTPVPRMGSTSDARPPSTADDSTRVNVSKVTPASESEKAAPATPMPASVFATEPGGKEDGPDAIPAPRATNATPEMARAKLETPRPTATPTATPPSAVTESGTPTSATKESPSAQPSGTKLEPGNAAPRAQPSPPVEAARLKPTHYIGDEHGSYPLSTPAPPMEVAKLTPMQPAPPAVDPASRATKEAPFVNSLAMKFVPIPDTTILMCVTDTTVAQFKTAGLGYQAPNFPQGPTHPAVNVSWEDARRFCARLSQKEKRTYRLPTNAEWSAAAGGELYPWGNQWPPQKGSGNYHPDCHVDKFQHTSPVGSFAANGNGLYDMGGNVWQWCEDWDTSKSEYRVLRGASWSDYDSMYLRSDSRDYGHPTSRSSDYGFRCVLVLSGD